jgi:asparagine synthase (glutamine-hydrolysing)
MPGIFGFFNKRGGDKSTSSELIAGMKSTMSHNPDYVSETYADDWCGLGNIGLPWSDEQRFLVDRSAGKAAAFSGFIYGWKNAEARKAVPDSRKAQRMIDLMQKHGRHLPGMIDGSFNALVADLQKKDALLCNDRFGHRQLYYYEDDRLFLFSTEYKAFLAYDGFVRELDIAGVSDYFNFDYPLGDKTFLRDVKILRGASVVIIDSTGVNHNTYWDFDFAKESRQGIQELIETADAVYEGIIKKRIGPSENIILPLSGGLDSRFILAHALKAGSSPHLFTHGSRNCLDHRIARRVAREMNAENYRFIEIIPYWTIDYAERFVFLTEGMTEASPAILLGIGEQYGLPAESTVFMNGIYGGPTNFGGPYYREYDLKPDISYDEKIANMARSLYGGSLTDQYYNLFAPDFRAALKSNHLSSLKNEFSRYLHIDGFHNQKDVFFIRNRLVRYMDQVDVNRYLWHDHFALSDDELVDFYIKLPPQLKLNRRFFMEYFKAKFPNLARIPYQATGVSLYKKPSALRLYVKPRIKKLKYYAGRLSRGKLRFYDKDNYHHFNQWYRAYGNIREFYEDLLLDNRTVQRGFFNRPAVESLLRRQREGGNSFYEISGLASFELFNRLFMD